MGESQKNKGSIMLLIVVLIAVVILLGTSVMSLTIMNYNMRLTNTQLIENMLKSDSGLDECFALSMMCYEAAYLDTEAYMQQQTEAIAEDIEDLKMGRASYVSCKNKIYIDSINLTVNTRALENQFLLYFQSSFDVAYKRSINGFYSQIDTGIKLSSSGPKLQAKNQVYHPMTTYENGGITRKNSIDLTVVPPTFRITNDVAAMDLPLAPITKSHWRIEYGE